MVPKSEPRVYKNEPPYFGMVTRTDLVKNMKRVSRKMPVYLYAPGGYGKTVAARQWSAETQSAWLRLDMSDNDASLFCRRLIKAIQDTVPAQQRPRRTAASSKTAIEQIEEALASLPKQIGLLVIDDVHVLTSPEARAVLTWLVSHAPPHLRLCLIGRGDPQELFGAESPCAVFDQRDFMFTVQETTELFTLRDIPCTPEQAKSSNEATNGWPIYLSALASNSTPLFDSLPEHEAIPSLFEFFETNVWQLWDADTQADLLRLSIPDSLTPDLAQSLTERASGEALLEQLSRQKSAFLEKTERGQWHFHDLFREFLQAKAEKQLDEIERAQLHGIVASHYFDRREYFNAAHHYLAGNDGDGLARCFIAANRFHEDAGNQSIEVSLAFTRQYLVNLPDDFIAGNAFILSKCALTAFCEGDNSQFLRHADALAALTPAIAYPSMLETAMFTIALDNHRPLAFFAKQAQARIAQRPRQLQEKNEAQTHTITLNLPLFHRSMRDYSELWELAEADIQMIRDSFGILIGEEYPPLEACLIAGMYYERNEMQAALFPVLEAYRGLHEQAQPETRFCVMMALCSVFSSMGATREAVRILEELSAFVATDKGRFLLPNLQAVETLAALRVGDTACAQDWLGTTGAERARLHFYRIFRHFVSLRALIAVGDFNEAIMFGTRLLALAKSYARPLDQIEAGILTAIAYKDIDRKHASILLMDAVKTARRYRFTRLFVQEGSALLPLLKDLQESSATPRLVARFAERIIDEIVQELSYPLQKGFLPLRQSPFGARKTPLQPPRLSRQQAAMLRYLDKGLTYSEIADELHVKRGTVKTHVLQLYKRLGVHSASEALAKARVLDMVE